MSRWKPGQRDAQRVGINWETVSVKVVHVKVELTGAGPMDRLAFGAMVLVDAVAFLESQVDACVMVPQFTNVTGHPGIEARCQDHQVLWTQRTSIVVDLHLLGIFTRRGYAENVTNATGCRVYKERGGVCCVFRGQWRKKWTSSLDCRGVGEPIVGCRRSNEEWLSEDKQTLL